MKAVISIIIAASSLVSCSSIDATDTLEPSQMEAIQVAAIRHGLGVLTAPPDGAEVVCVGIGQSTSIAETKPWEREVRQIDARPAPLSTTIQHRFRAGGDRSPIGMRR